MYSRRSTVNGFPMCVEGLRDFSNKADTSDSPTVRFLVLVPPLHVTSRFPDSSCCILLTLNSASSHQQTRRHLLPLPKVAAAWIESVFFFCNQRNNQNFLILPINKKAFKQRWCPAPQKRTLWPLTFYSLGMFEVTKKVPNIAVVSFSVPHFENPQSLLRYTHKKRSAS